MASWVRIPLTRGRSTVVDLEDYIWLSQWRWFYETAGYAARDERGKRVKMHRVIMGAAQGLEVDHKNCDGEIGGLNNRRYNLRLATHAQNQRNLRKPTSNTSGYKGVSWDKTRQKWVAYIWSGKSLNLGGFKTREEAALAYDKASRFYHGDFGRTNSG